MVKKEEDVEKRDSGFPEAICTYPEEANILRKLFSKLPSKSTVNNYLPRPLAK